jgi:fructose-1,6-bisphosphatase/inositol monophosphatase family enzyme
MTAQTDAEIAIAAAGAGARVVREMYGRADLSRISKSPTDFATEADLAAEQAIHAVLAERCPGDGFLGEETGLTAGARGSRLWLVDPLCGTLNFAAQTPLFAVNVALSAADRVSAAAACDPMADELYWTDGSTACVRRDGQDEPLAPSARSRLVDVNCDGRGDFVGPQLLTDPAFRAAFGPRVISTTLAVAWVAAGQRAGYVTDGNLERSVHFAAGIALCQAAGCVVTALDGGPVHRGRGLIAAADLQTHRALLDLVRPWLATA